MRCKHIFSSKRVRKADVKVTHMTK